MPELIRLGISTCPNDTFAFHGLLQQAVDWRGLDFAVELLDIDQLNEGLRDGRFDVAKVSFFAAVREAAHTVVLPSGSALGFGVGPLLLAARPGTVPTKANQVTLCPGETTTANLLFSLFYPGTTRVEQTRFSEIMPRLQQATADFGVCIHEGRFTWQQAGLALVEDLGARWESETGGPLPLGGIVADNQLPRERLQRVQRVIRDSLDYALAKPSRALPTMREHAQEFSDEVLMQHVELYVNRWTLDLGETGSAALAALSQRVREVGLLSADAVPLRVLGD